MVYKIAPSYLVFMQQKQNDNYLETFFWTDLL
jgi:hypothetical protein